MKATPKVSVIIPIAPDGQCEASVASVRRQNYDPAKIEILVAVGRHRSIQRNTALSRATGEIIWFMDNDVHIDDPEYLTRMVAYYQDPDVASVGGPSLTIESDSFFQKSVGMVLGTYFATQAARARYRKLGVARLSSEKELILCSQSFRTAFIKDKAFDARLHSGNEENELMNRLQEEGHKMWYDPELPVFRSQRSSLSHFIQQIGKYGKSRMEHFFIKPVAFEAAFMAPLFFYLYAVTVPVVNLPFIKIPLLLKSLYAAPLGIYGLVNFISAIGIALRSKRPGMFFTSLFLLPLTHMSYALGNLYALKTRFVSEKRDIPDVVVNEIKV